MFRTSPKSKSVMYPCKNKCALGRQSDFDKENSKSIHEIGSNFRTKNYDHKNVCYRMMLTPFY